MYSICFDFSMYHVPHILNRMVLINAVEETAKLCNLAVSAAAALAAAKLYDEYQCRLPLAKQVKGVLQPCSVSALIVAIRATRKTGEQGFLEFTVGLGARLLPSNEQHLIILQQRVPQLDAVPITDAGESV